MEIQCCLSVLWWSAFHKTDTVRRSALVDWRRKGRQWSHLYTSGQLWDFLNVLLVCFPWIIVVKSPSGILVAVIIFLPCSSRKNIVCPKLFYFQFFIDGVIKMFRNLSLIMNTIFLFPCSSCFSCASCGKGC